jgi:hypothetical protein
MCGVFFVPRDAAHFEKNVLIKNEIEEKRELLIN